LKFISTNNYYKVQNLFNLEEISLRLNSYVKGVHYFYMKSKVGILKKKEKANNNNITEEAILL